MKILSFLFPFRLHLTVLQLESYELKRFWPWLIRHPLTRRLEGKKGLTWNLKARLLYVGAFLLAWLCLLISLSFGPWAILLAVILFIVPALPLSAVALALKPLEFYYRQLVKQRIVEKLARLKKTKVIGISGSYGKTSTKVFLYHLLRSHYRVLKTPGSYNTLLGIAKVIDIELTKEYDFFICEMGAHYPGDIKEIAEIVQPNYGLVTGLNEQHLERFGSLEKAIRTELELLQSLPAKTPAFIAIDNPLLAERYQDYPLDFTLFGLADKKNTIKNIKTTTKGTTFTLVLNGKEHSATTALIGSVHLANILGAATVAYALGVPAQKIIEQIKTLKAVAHRLEIKELPELKITLIDDAYSSNPTGFREALKLLAEFKEPKILVTPGIIELGSATTAIHQELGQRAAEVCDYLILVGRNERTKILAEARSSKTKVIFIDQVNQFTSTLKKLDLPHAVVLLENDLPENY